MKRFCNSVLAGLLLVAALPAAAFDYRSVDVPATVMYDAPSQKAKRLYIVHRYTPLEVVVSLDTWTKVRDIEGTIAWVERSALADNRMVMVSVAQAQIRQAPQDGAALVFDAERSVALELLEPAAGGWAKVRHLDGAIGYVRANQIWGL
jgi:SH3-like domain-containing protein